MVSSAFARISLLAGAAIVPAWLLATASADCEPKGWGEACLPGFCPCDPPLVCDARLERCVCDPHIKGAKGDPCDVAGCPRCRAPLECISTDAPQARCGLCSPRRGAKIGAPCGQASDEECEGCSNDLICDPASNRCRCRPETSVGTMCGSNGCPCSAGYRCAPRKDCTACGITPSRCYATLSGGKNGGTIPRNGRLTSSITIPAAIGFTHLPAVSVMLRRLRHLRVSDLTIQLRHANPFWPSQARTATLFQRGYVPLGQFHPNLQFNGTYTFCDNGATTLEGSTALPVLPPKSSAIVVRPGTYKASNNKDCRAAAWGQPDCFSNITHSLFGSTFRTGLCGVEEAYPSSGSVFTLELIDEDVCSVCPSVEDGSLEGWDITLW